VRLDLVSCPRNTQHNFSPFVILTLTLSLPKGKGKNPRISFAVCHSERSEESPHLAPAHAQFRAPIMLITLGTPLHVFVYRSRLAILAHFSSANGSAALAAVISSSAWTTCGTCQIAIY
jgi:hypothetical protein